jgi:hypothetical protein
MALGLQWAVSCQAMHETRERPCSLGARCIQSIPQSRDGFSAQGPCVLLGLFNQNSVGKAFIAWRWVTHVRSPKSGWGVMTLFFGVHVRNTAACKSVLRRVQEHILAQPLPFRHGQSQL